MIDRSMIAYQYPHKLRTEEVRVIELQEIPLTTEQQEIRDMAWQAIARVNNIKEPWNIEIYRAFIRDPKSFVRAVNNQLTPVAEI